MSRGSLGRVGSITVVGLTVNRGVVAANGPWSQSRVEAAVTSRDSPQGRDFPVILVVMASSGVGGDLDGGVLR